MKGYGLFLMAVLAVSSAVGFAYGKQEVRTAAAAAPKPDLDHRRVTLMVLVQELAERTGYKVASIVFTETPTEYTDQAVVTFVKCDDVACTPQPVVFVWNGASSTDGNWGIIRTAQSK